MYSAVASDSTLVNYCRMGNKGSLPLEAVDGFSTEELLYCTMYSAVANDSTLVNYCRMGNKGSLPLEAVDGFSTEEVSRLEKRFKKLDLDQNGTIRFAVCPLYLVQIL